MDHPLYINIKGSTNAMTQIAVMRIFPYKTEGVEDFIQQHLGQWLGVLQRQPTRGNGNNRKRPGSQGVEAMVVGS